MTKMELEIMRTLNGVELTSAGIALRINRPKPSVRRTLVAMKRRGLIACVPKAFRLPYKYMLLRPHDDV